MSEQYDFSAPLRIDMNKIPPIAHKDFYEQTGMDILDFARLMESGKINVDNYLKNLEPLTAFLWVMWRMKYRDLTLEQTWYEGLGEMLESIDFIADPNPESPSTPPQERVILEQNSLPAEPPMTIRN